MCILFKDEKYKADTIEIIRQLMDDANLSGRSEVQWTPTYTTPSYISGSPDYTAFKFCCALNRIKNSSHHIYWSNRVEGQLCNKIN